MILKMKVRISWSRPQIEGTESVLLYRFALQNIFIIDTNDPGIKVFIEKPIHPHARSYYRALMEGISPELFSCSLSIWSTKKVIYPVPVIHKPTKISRKKYEHFQILD